MYIHPKYRNRNGRKKLHESNLVVLYYVMFTITAVEAEMALQSGKLVATGEEEHK